MLIASGSPESCALNGESLFIGVIGKFELEM